MIHLKFAPILFLAALSLTVSNLPSRVMAADEVSPEPAASDKDKDIPKAPKSADSAETGKKDDNFGRFVKLSKKEFDNDAKLKAQFKNYGQYVKSLHHRDGDGDDHGRPGDAGKGGSGGPGAGKGPGAAGGGGSASAGSGSGHGGKGGKGAGAPASSTGAMPSGQ